MLLVLAASLTLAGAFGSVAEASSVGTAVPRAAVAPSRAAPADPRLCTIGQRCVPSAPGNPSGALVLPGSLAFLAAVALLVLRVGRHRREPVPVVPGAPPTTIFRPPIASLG